MLVDRTAARLHDAGVRRGDRVGVRVASGSKELYASILGVLAAGAAYVPVDADDPDERARLVFGEAQVTGIIGDGGVYLPSAPPAEPVSAAPLFDGSPPHPSTRAITVVPPPTVDDDAWIIFTSGSTGVPKGVAVSHRSAAAFVDAEARLFLQDAPLGPGDRVLAGLSVAFDASCEEMWLAWRYGACLVPAPRSLVRSGEDLAPWLVRQAITVVSTVPTLAAMWPTDSIENVRLLIFGGEAVPPELAVRLAADGREVWNTYGPTEATVVACAALLGDDGPVRIGLPLDGWSLAVVDAEGQPVAEGESGELIIGGIGLARYLDPAKDAEKYAPMPSLGWERAYRSGDLVRFDVEGLIFQGRADDQVKVGGRRIELGEVENALQDLPGVTAAAAAVRTTDAGVPVLVGYLVVSAPDEFERGAARMQLAQRLPSAIVPLLALVDDLPVRTSGKVDRDALPWPLPGVEAPAVGFTGTEAWLAEQWQSVLGMPVPSRTADFFDLGGGSLAAAQLVSRIRTRVPEFSVADIYDVPRLGAMAKALGVISDDDDAVGFRHPEPTPRSAQWVQTLVGLPLFILTGIRWLLYLLTASALLQLAPGFEALPTAPWWVIIVGLLVFATPFGRMTVSVVVRARAARRAEARRLPSRRRDAPAPVARRADRRPGRRGRSRRRALGDVLRAGTRREGGQGRRPPHPAAHHRHARDRRPRRHRARGGPARLLDRRRPAAPRRGAHRRRCDDRRAEHARPGNPHRTARRDRAGISRVRPRARGSVLGRIAGRPRRRGGRGLADRARAPPTAVALGVRRVVRAARPAADRGLRGRGSRHRAGDPRRRHPARRVRPLVRLARAGHTRRSASCSRHPSCSS